MLDKVVYFSGVHSSGKSSLIKKLSQYNGFLIHKRVHYLQLEDTYLRSVWRLTKHYIEAREQEELSLKNNEKIILADRCVYCNFAYMNAFLRMGWVSNKEIEHHNKIFEALFTENFKPRNIVYLSPPFDWVKDRLKERWKTKPRKWREDDFEYLQNVVESFSELYAELGCNVLKLDESDIDMRCEKVINWLNMLGVRFSTVNLNKLD